MSSNPLLTKFMELVAYDQSVRVYEDQLLNLVDEIIDLEEQQEVEKLNLTKLSDQIKNLKKIVDTKELEMKDLDAKVQAIKSKFDAVATSREYEIIKKELEAAGQEQSNFEDELLAAWTAYDNAQKNIHKQEAILQGKENNLKQIITEKNQKKVELETQIEQKNKEHCAQEVDVPAQWLIDYARIKRSFSNPVVPVENGSCSACYTSLAVHEMSNLARKQLSPCMGCFRFLFIGS